MFGVFLALAVSIPPRPLVTKQAPLKIPTNDNGLACTFCQELVRAIEDYLKDGKTQEEIVQLLKPLCEKFPASYAPLCDQLVDQYVPVIISWVEKEAEAFDVCTKLGLCQQTQKARVVKADNGKACDICQQVVNYIATLLTQSYTEAEIVALVEQLCSSIPAPFSLACDAIASKYVPVIIEWLAKEMTAVDICSKVGLCSTKAVPRFVKQNNADNGKVCDICQQVVNYIATLLTQSYTEAEIVALVEKLCTSIPAPFSLACDAIAAKYVPVIIEWLAKELTAVDICSKVGLCSTKALPRIAVPAKADNGLVCEVCKQLVFYVEDLIQEQKTQEEIIALAQKLCDKIPAPYGAICDTLVAQYIPQIIKWLEQEIEIIDICAKLNLCQAQQKKVAAKKVENRPARLPTLAARAASKKIGCDPCKDTIQWIEKELKTYSIPALWKLISVECPKVKFISKFCAIITESDLDTLFNLIVAKLPPLKVCQWIKLC